MLWKRCFVMSLLTMMACVPLSAQEPSQLLKKDVGTWKCEIRLFADPNQPPAISHGTETNFMIGNSWLISHMKCKLADMDFEGSSQIGYDTQSKKFVGTWVDSMSTSAMKTESTWDEKTQTMTTIGVSKDAEGKEVKHRMTVVYNKDGTRFFTMYQKFGDAEPKIMEIKYTKGS